MTFYCVTSNSPEKRRKRPEDTTGTIEKEERALQYISTDTSQAFSVLHSVRAFLSQSSSTTRLSLDASFTPALRNSPVASLGLINHAARFKRFWREKRQRVSSLFHRSTTGLYLSHVSTVFAKRCAPEYGAEECNTPRIIT